jgi:hypothetical protein
MRSVAALGAALWLVAGCGSGSSGPKLTTSVGGDRPLSGLTPTENQTLCDEDTAFSASAGLDKDLCRTSAFAEVIIQDSLTPGMTETALRTSCAEAYTSCLTGMGLTCEEFLPACTALVSDLVTCANDSVAYSHAAALAVPACDAITKAALQAAESADGGATATPPPASCATFLTMCPASARKSNGNHPDGGT